MKKQEGITLVSVTIYVLIMAIVIGVIATISSFFYSNIVTVKDGGQNAAEFDKFNMYFIEDTKQKQNRIADIDKQNNRSIRFSNGNQYTFQDGSIYRNSTKICNHVTDAGFKVRYEYDKTIVVVYISIGENSEFTKTTEYTLNNQSGSTPTD